MKCVCSKAKQTVAQSWENGHYKNKTKTAQDMYVHTLTWCVQHRSLDTEARRRIWTDICVERVIGWWAGQWNWNTDTVSSGTCWRFILWYLHTRAEEKDHRPASLIPTSSSLLSPSWLGKLRLTNQLQRSNWTPDGHTEGWQHLYWYFHLDADSIL